MTFPVSPTEQQGQYRYDPSTLAQQAPARLFSYGGEDGTVRYVVTKLRQNLLHQGKLSSPWDLLLQQLEQGIYTIEQTWAQLGTLLVDLEVFQSNWLNFNLPPNEQFSSAFVRERREMGEVLLAARKAAQAIAPSTPAQQRQAFYQVLEANDRARPVISQIFEREGELSDREFARQRLAGQNPMVLRRVQANEPMLQSLASATLNLTQIAADRRLFVADYPLLQTLTAADLQTGRYVGSPVALFQRGDRSLEPILIQLEPGHVATPASESDDWMRAKLYTQTADVTHHELVDHLCNTHLAMEAFAIATPRQLPATHPLYRLLRPHFQFLLAINTRGNTILLSEGAAIDKLMAPTRAASIGLMNQAYRQRQFQDYALPKDLDRRGLQPEFLPEFPYRDDAQLLWTAISGYVTRFLQRYYRDDRAVQSDAALQAWAAELGAPLSSRSLAEFPQAPAWMPPEWSVETGLAVQLPDHARVPGFPTMDTAGTIADLQQLIDLTTQVIFTCSAQHAAVNFSQFDYVGYAPNAPLALYSRPDMHTTLAELLPSASQGLGQMELTFALSGIRWGQLGSADLIQFVDQGDRQTLAQFQADLAEVELKIGDRNRERLATTGVDYPYLLPSRIPNSINI